MNISINTLKSTSHTTKSLTEVFRYIFCAFLWHQNKKHQVEDSNNKAAMTLMFRMIVHNPFMRTENAESI